jgi:threonine synthase
MGLPEGTMEKEDHDEMMKHLHKMLSSYDQRDAVLEHIKKMMEMKHMSEEPSAHAEESEKQMSALAENYNRLQTEFQDFVRLVGETVGIHSAELE